MEHRRAGLQDDDAERKHSGNGPVNQALADAEDKPRRTSRDARKQSVRGDDALADVGLVASLNSGGRPGSGQGRKMSAHASGLLTGRTTATAHAVRVPATESAPTPINLDDGTTLIAVDTARTATTTSSLPRSAVASVREPVVLSTVRTAAGGDGIGSSHGAAVKQRSPSADRLEDTPHPSTLAHAEPPQDVFFRAYRGAGYRRRPDRKWSNIHEHAKKKPLVSATVTSVLSTSENSMTASPGLAATHHLTIFDAAGAHVSMDDVNGAAAFFGFFTGQEMIDKIRGDFPGLIVREVDRVAVELTRTRHLFKEMDKAADWDDMLPRAVGDVTIEKWAKRSRMAIDQYRRSFAWAHGLLSLAEVRHVHAFIAKGYTLENAVTATVAARSGLEIVRYRDLIWLTVHRSKHTVFLRQLMTGLLLMFVLAHGLAVSVLPLTGSNPQELNPDYVRTSPSSPFRYVDQPYDKYWNWIPNFNASDLFPYLRIARILGWIWIVVAVVDMRYNMMSANGQRRMLDRGLQDTYVNRLLRFWNAFLCWNFLVNVFALGVYAKDGTTTADPGSARTLAAISMIMTYALTSPYFVCDVQSPPASVKETMQVLFVDLCTNWLEILRIFTICAFIVLCIPIHLLYILIAIARVLFEGTCGDMRNPFCVDGCLCGDGGLLSYCLSLWSGFVMAVVDEYLL